MISDEVFIDFSLPNTPDTLKFIKLNPSDKLKAVALGVKFLTSGNQQIQSWDNSQWESKLKQIQEEKQELIITLEEKLHLEHLKRQNLVKTQKEEINSIVEGVRNRTESKYLSEIASLNDKIIPKQIIRAGIAVASKLIAKPRIIFVACPVSDDFAIL